MEPPSIAELSMPSESVAGSSAHNMNNASQTEIRVEYIKHRWEVKNFSHCYQEYLENYVNLPRGEDVLTWSIKIYPKGNGENNKDFVFLCLNRVIGNNVKNNKIGFRSRFFLKNSEGKDIEMRIHPNPSHSDYVSYIKRDVLFPQISPADSITVLVEIDVAVETITTQCDEPLGVCNYEKQLADDYLKLLKEDLLTDFTIKVNDKEIRVHKAILAARSPVFSAMLSHEATSESKTGILVIQDVEFNVVKEMLNFIYCGRSSSEINELASDLLIAADKYRLDELKSHCERCLVQALNQENACHLLIIGDMYRADLLRHRAVQYILQHPKEITSTSGWETVLSEHPQLVTDIVRSFDKSCGPLSSISGPAELSSSAMSSSHFSCDGNR
ncbi:BTB/POZ domain-containing protein [Ditylenchus destructor]|nr:BTB/POZ domain-containing protein [Ditylenchus destructor]